MWIDLVAGHSGNDLLGVDAPGGPAIGDVGDRGKRGLEVTASNKRNSGGRVGRQYRRDEPCYEKGYRPDKPHAVLLHHRRQLTSTRAET